MEPPKPDMPKETETTGGEDSPGPLPRAAAKRNSLTKGVIASWLGYVVVVVSGFILPRMIDRTEGMAALGIWDFGWAIVANVNLLSLGIGSAVNRYVSRARAKHDDQELNATVNSAMLLLLISFGLAATFVVIFAQFTHLFLPEATPAEQSTGYWLVLVLGMSAALSLPFGCVNGVITGCERFDLLNLIRGLRDVFVLLIGFGLLWLGWGLLWLGVIVLVGEVVSDLVKVLVVRRICPELQFAPRRATKDAVRDVLGFGGKTVVQSGARAGLYQLNSFLIPLFLGTASLAIYRRQLVLVLHTLRFIKSYSQVFVPRAGALHAQGDTAGLGALLVRSSRYGFFATLPMTTFLLIMGDPILTIWMGSEYQAPMILAVLAVGHLFAIAQQSAYSILMGMGKHGLPSFVDLAAAVVSAILGITLLMAGAEAFGAALSVSIPVMISGGIILPWYACRMLSVPLGAYARESMLAPFVINLPLIACLLFVRWLEAEHAVVSVCGGLVLGAFVQGPLYWHYVVPPTTKSQVRKRFFPRPMSA